MDMKKKMKMTRSRLAFDPSSYLDLASIAIPALEPGRAIGPGDARAADASKSDLSATNLGAGGLHLPHTFATGGLRSSIRAAEDIVISRVQNLRQRLMQPGLGNLFSGGEKMLQDEKDALFLRAMCMHAMGRIRAALHVYAMAFACDAGHVGYH